jgi:hypothetical protein
LFKLLHDGIDTGKIPGVRDTGVYKSPGSSAEIGLRITMTANNQYGQYKKEPAHKQFFEWMRQ